MILLVSVTCFNKTEEQVLVDTTTTRNSFQYKYKYARSFKSLRCYRCNTTLDKHNM